MRWHGALRIGAIVVIVPIVALVGLMILAGAVWILEAPGTLALGWVRYLWRVIPQLNPDPWTIGTAIVCLGGVVTGAHFFLRWLVGREWPWKRTLRCVGLVVLMFVAGIAMVGMAHQTAWLVRSPEPLTQGGIRVSTARMQSTNHLKQICLAAHNHHDNSNPSELPRSTFDATGQPIHSWQAALLPYIEQDALYGQIDRTKPWTHLANAQPMSRLIKTYLNPALPHDPVNDFGVSHYAGNAFVVMGDAKRIDRFPAGTSNTILAGEVTLNVRAWGDPLNARDPRIAKSFAGPNGRPAQFAMLDGSVRTFDSQELAELVGKIPE